MHGDAFSLQIQVLNLSWPHWAAPPDHSSQSVEPRYHIAVYYEGTCMIQRANGRRPRAAAQSTTCLLRKGCW